MLVARTYCCRVLVQGKMPQRAERNPQTVAFLEMLGLPYDLEAASGPWRAAAPVAGERTISRRVPAVHCWW